MRELNDVFPGTDRIYFTDFDFKPVIRTGAGRIVANGYARDRRDIVKLDQRLVGDLFGMLQRMDVDGCSFVANRLAAAICTVDGCNYDALHPEDIRESIVNR